MGYLAISKTQSVVSHGKNNLKSCLWPNSLYHAASFANFKGILGCFVPLIILADLLGNTCLLVIGAFRSTLFVSVFQGLFSCDRPVSGNSPLNFFEVFSDLSYFVSCKNKAMSASCPRQKVHSSLQFPSLFFSSLESFSVLFLQAKLDECVAIIVICINSPPTQMTDGTEKPVRSLQMHSAIQRIWL